MQVVDEAEREEGRVPEAGAYAERDTGADRDVPSVFKASDNTNGQYKAAQAACKTTPGQIAETSSGGETTGRNGSATCSWAEGDCRSTIVDVRGEAGNRTSAPLSRPVLDPAPTATLAYYQIMCLRRKSTSSSSPQPPMNPTIIARQGNTSTGYEQSRVLHLQEGGPLPREDTRADPDLHIHASTHPPRLTAPHAHRRRENHHPLPSSSYLVPRAECQHHRPARSDEHEEVGGTMGRGARREEDGVDEVPKRSIRPMRGRRRWWGGRSNFEAWATLKTRMCTAEEDAEVQ
ncbi:hypothetical protein R3P38DRAFT_3449670 [Favolaschia claudopus]|uniref:Uncharacterized protein n=1 Tax=Favolaschia claudopus TaxID=2862362 RepID=A0AAW0CVT7_9AGAR